ncbi:MAG TPA: hypothetical protein EYQ50_12665 [Verrucomicrobiales bacterium]|nr:hypothetical protein [Verrucomicrobiales bacterium]
MRLPTSSTTPRRDAEKRIFKITHPFHPLKGKVLEIVTYRRNWDEDRIYFYERKNELVSVSASWTDILAPDPFVSVASGRALFRTGELKRLVALINELDQPLVDQATKLIPKSC